MHKSKSQQGYVLDLPSSARAISWEEVLHAEEDDGSCSQISGVGKSHHILNHQYSIGQKPISLSFLFKVTSPTQKIIIIN